ncbi:MAG: hypothetical protein SCJ94_02610 [Bacillota bacterium]|nr:hypothetical protein [Bacillota bacterium]
MVKDIILLVVSAAVVVAAVKYLLMSGIGIISAVFKLSAKARNFCNKLRLLSS